MLPSLTKPSRARCGAKRPRSARHFIVSGHLTEVVGVAEDGKYHDLHESPAGRVSAAFPDRAGERVFVVRLRRTPSEMAAALERTLSGIEPNVPIAVHSWAEDLAAELFPARAATVALGVMGLVGGDAGSDRHLRHGSLQRKSPNEGVGHPCGFGRAQDASDERGRWGRPMVVLAVGSAVGLLSGVFATKLLGQIVYQAESVGSRGRGRRGANDGAARHCSLRHSSPASTIR